jgi:hypothetical protein
MVSAILTLQNVPVSQSGLTSMKAETRSPSRPRPARIHCTSIFLATEGPIDTTLYTRSSPIREEAELARRDGRSMYLGEVIVSWRQEGGLAAQPTGTGLLLTSLRGFVFARAWTRQASLPHTPPGSFLVKAGQDHPIQAANVCQHALLDIGLSQVIDQGVSLATRCHVCKIIAKGCLLSRAGDSGRDYMSKTSSHREGLSHHHRSLRVSHQPCHFTSSHTPGIHQG